MIIKKIKKNKKDYTIYIDNNEYQIEEDILVKFSLYKDKKITQSLLDELLNENNIYKAYNKALKYLSYKMRSELEIFDYLKKDFSLNEIESSIEKLKKNRIINEDKYVEAYINDQFNLTNNGPYKIKKNLEKKGVKKEIIVDKDFNHKLDNIINKRVKRNNDSLYTFKIKTSKYLNNLGYHYEMYSEKLNSVYFDEMPNIKRDYIKLKNKKNEKEIKNKLYKKGYNLSLIEKVLEEK